MTHSLQARLVLRTAWLVAALVSLAAVAIYLLMRASLVAEFDAALLLEARSLTPHVELSGDQVGLEFELGQLPEYSREDHPRYFEIWTHDGKVQGKSQSLGAEDLATPTGSSHAGEIQAVVLPTGLAGRQLALGFQPRIEDEEPNYRAGGKQMTIVVARDTAELDGTLRTLAGFLFLVTLATVVASVTLLRRVVAMGLAPLNVLASSIEKVAVEDLSERIRCHGAPSEMTNVVQRLNGLLARLEQALSRERAITAEVAHELRTPLAGLQTALEVSAARPREPVEYRRTIAQCLSVAQQMHSMVENLLVLARADARQLKIEREAVDVEALVLECWSPFEQIARDKSIDVIWHVDPLCLLLDRDKTRLVLKNVFENAAAHCDLGGWIHTTCACDGTQYEVTVSNSGCRIVAQDVARLFDRFWRGDDARTEAAAHCGLGLALCQKVMEVLGGTIVAKVDAGQFSVSLSFPTSPAPLAVHSVTAGGRGQLSGA